MNTPYKFFEKGLSLYEQYAVQNILSKTNVQPGSQYDAKTIHEAINSVLNINTVIKCAKAKGSDGEQYLHEIQLCFNKQWQLIDCAPKNLNGRTKCDLKKKIHYLSKMPEDTGDESSTWKFLIHFISIMLLVAVVLFAYKWAKSRKAGQTFLSF